MTPLGERDYMIDESTGERVYEPSVRDTPGDYEKRGDGGYEGICAGCRMRVAPNDPSVIRYHPTISGGIFHARCEPSASAGWYALEDQGEAPDV